MHQPPSPVGELHPHRADHRIGHRLAELVDDAARDDAAARQRDVRPCPAPARRTARSGAPVRTAGAGRTASSRSRTWYAHVEAAGREFLELVAPFASVSAVLVPMSGPRCAPGRGEWTDPVSAATTRPRSRRCRSWPAGPGAQHLHRHVAGAADDDLARADYLAGGACDAASRREAARGRRRLVGAWRHFRRRTDDFGCRAADFTLLQVPPRITDCSGGMAIGKGRPRS